MDSPPTPFLESLEFEASTFANGPATDDLFYKVPKGAAEAAPGTTLKVEVHVDTSRYLLPPATAMSRLIYQSENLNGSRTPASAFILWPYFPRTQADGYPIVAWAHGTSGFSANGAPSNHKSLFQHWIAPFQLAVNGFVVVAPDYAGLGVGKHASGEPIVHEYLACSSQANDLVYAVHAAQQSFSELSKDFVALGHSQGGGAAWATAQRQVSRPIAGYLGAVAISPLTSLFEQPGPGFVELIGAAICPGVASAFPDFKLENVLTEEGQQRLALVEQSGAQLASGILILQGVELMKAGWTKDPHMQKYNALASNGGKKIGGPLLVIHGEADDRLNVNATTKAVESTVKSFPFSLIEYVLLPGVTHTPAIPASQRLWMDWIADRFAGRELRSGCQRTTLAPARQAANYQAEQNWYVECATQSYHAP